MNMSLAVALVVMSAIAPTPTLVRVAVIDNSPSMHGERIAAVRKELQTIVEKMPPSSQFPLLLIVFHGSVDPTQVLTDSDAARRAIAALNGDGTGTRIAPALTRAVEELRPFRQTSDVLILLFTDGEDSDRQAIAKAESQLDTLFADRSQRGLNQTVYVKRWGNANAELIQHIRARGHAQVVDAGELNIGSMAVEPKVIIQHIERDSADLLRLRITYSPELHVRGTPPGGSPPAANFECQNPGATGQTRESIVAGAPPGRCVLTLPIPADAERAGKLELGFLVTPASGSAKKFVLPLRSSSTLMIPVPLPPLAVHNRATADIRSVTALEWEDALAEHVRCKLTVALAVTAIEPAVPIDRSTTFKVTAGDRTKLLAGGDAVTVPGPGVYDLPFLVNIPLDKKTQDWPPRTCEFVLNFQPIPNSAQVSYSPASLQVRHAGVPVPSRVQTVITPQVRRVNRPAWVDVFEPLAAFDAEVMFRVQGPIPEHTTLTLVSPGAVRNNVLPPHTHISSGETTVTLHVIAKLAPGNTAQLDFSIVPPTPTAAVEYRVERGFVLPVIAPACASIVHVDGFGPQSVIQATLADNQDTLDLLLRPVLAGVDVRLLKSLPRVRATTRSADVDVIAGIAKAFDSQSLRVQLRGTEERSFFTDTEQSIPLDLETEQSSAAVTPGHVTILVHRQAPCKRLLTYLAWALFPVGLLSLVVRIVRRLREPVSL